MTERAEVSDADRAMVLAFQRGHGGGTLEDLVAAARAEGRKDAIMTIMHNPDMDSGSLAAGLRREGYEKGYAAGVAAEREATGSRAAYAGFGAWAFEQFWHDAEPGDIDAGDAQEAAIKYGLLRRRVEGDEGATCGTEIGCDYSPGDPVSKCECLFPVFAPLRARAGAPSPQVEGNAQLGGTGASGGDA